MAPMARASPRVLGGTFHSVAHHFVRRHAAALGLPPGFGVLDAGDAADVLDLLREEHGHAAARTALSEEEHPARRLLPDRQRPAAAGRSPVGVVPVVRGTPRGHSRAVQGLHGAKADARRDRPRRPAAVLARACRRRRDRTRARGRLRPRPDRRVPGRQQPPGRHRARASPRPPRCDRGGRRLPGHLRLEGRLGPTHPRVPRTVPRRDRRHLGAQLPLDAAHPRHCERALGAGHEGVSEAATRRARGRGAARACVHPG